MDCLIDSGYYRIHMQSIFCLVKAKYIDIYSISLSG